MLRADIHRAGRANWKSFQRNIDAYIANARSYVRISPEIDEAFVTAGQRCQEFATEIANRGPLYSQNDPAIKQALILALLAIDELEGRLQDAGPSDTAVSLGLGW